VIHQYAPWRKPWLYRGRNLDWCPPMKESGRIISPVGSCSGWRLSFPSAAACCCRTTSTHAVQHRAFIEYWPPAKGSKQLRLAIKDNIDMKGVVSSAGSQYFAENKQPAAQDAPCLAIARQRGVQFVGKTNLSEFAVAPSGFQTNITARRKVP